MELLEDSNPFPNSGAINFREEPESTATLQARIKNLEEMDRALEVSLIKE